MLGKSVALAAAASALLIACAHDVKQDSNTGADGVVKGAKNIPLDQNEGKAAGIVTYPGGDRVDWKMVELPDKQHGELDVRLTWVPPRPGLQLAFDIFDQWNHPVVTSKSTHNRKSRIRTAALANATGKYYIRIYAVGRGDAGKYKVGVEFKPDVTTAFDYHTLDVPDPPHLASLPEIEKECDEFAFDPKLPACRQVCPQVGAPPNWPACAGKCLTPDVNNKACWATMDCPNPPDRRIKSCKSVFPKCDLKNIDPANPNCEGVTAAAPDPITGRVIHTEVVSDGTNITVSVGQNAKIDKTWTGKLLRDNGSPVDNGEVTIIRVAGKTTLAKVKVTNDIVNDNPTVKFYPPK